MTQIDSKRIRVDPIADLAEDICAPALLIMQAMCSAAECVAPIHIERGLSCTECGCPIFTTLSTLPIRRIDESEIVFRIGRLSLVQNIAKELQTSYRIQESRIFLKMPAELYRFRVEVDKLGFKNFQKKVREQWN